MLKNKIVKTITMLAATAMAVVVIPTTVKADAHKFHAGDRCPCGNGVLVVQTMEDEVRYLDCSTGDPSNGVFCSDIGTIFMEGNEGHPYSESECPICHQEINCSNHNEEWYEMECEPGTHFYGCINCGVLDSSKTHMSSENRSDCTLCNSPHNNSCHHEDIRFRYKDLDVHEMFCRNCGEVLVTEEHSRNNGKWSAWATGHYYSCKCGWTLLNKYPDDSSLSHDPEWEDETDCSGNKIKRCKICGLTSDVPVQKNEKKEERSRDLSKEAFGGREASQLSVAEQKSSVSYALDSLRASGNALAANVVTSNNGGNGKASDIAAVVADNRDAANQQMFAQYACANLGFKNVTPLATYNMYSLHSSYTAKNGAQVITWANTGLKAGDTAFVVWYNQKLGRIELLPAMVDAAGNVLVNVPALGDVSTMTVVKASK